MRKCSKTIWLAKRFLNTSVFKIDQQQVPAVESLD